MRCRAAILFVACICALLAAADDNNSREQLQQVNQRIDRVNRLISTDTQKISSNTATIRKLDKQIKPIGERLRKLRQQSRELSRQLSLLRTESGELLGQLQRQRQQIGVLINAAYRQMFRKTTRLAPVESADERLVRHYYRLFEQNYAQQYEYYRLLGQRKRKNEQRVQQQGARLQQNQRALLREQSKLEDLREQRRRTAVELQKQINANEKYLAQLLREKQALEQLLSSVEGSARRSRRSSGVAFSSLRGKLSAPVSPAQLRARFGDQRGGGITWDGLLLGAAPGSYVVAAANGRVAFSGPLKAMGNYVVIDHGEGYLSVYNASELLVKKGSTVRQGQRIARVQNSGGASPTVYFALRHRGRALNPASWVARSW